MVYSMDKAYYSLFYSFFGIYVFLIYPWGESYYYANAKAYYFIGCILLLSLFHLLRVWLGKNKLIWKLEKLDALLVAFLCLLFFSTLHSIKISWVGEGTEHQGLLIMLSYIILFSLASRLYSVHLERLSKVIIISSFFASFYSVIQYYHLSILPQDSVNKLLFGQRTYSFFDNPDYFGSYLVLVIPLTITNYFLSQERKWRVLYFFILCFQFLSLIESQTRSAWLGIVISLTIILVWVVLNRREIWRKLVFIIISACFIFTISDLASHQGYFSRALTITNDIHKIIINKDASSAGSSRLDIWQISLPLISNHLWLGNGPNTFEDVFYSQDSKIIKNYLGSGNEIYDENNDYLQIAFTMGVPALLNYLLILSIIVIKGIRQVKQLDIDQKLFSIGMLAAIVGYLVQGFFNISVISVAPYFWLILGFFVNKDRFQGLNRRYVS
ncbi:O-antigen ligase family protein [Neobacillus sp. NRS-1170]|uniref:O-antigen ligase family protein n=1 Tax=Neobacillus sp. NRS-1170 TaxID=3233898 RepID=UPI003D2CACDD